jgi:hypothetical protein
MMNTEQWNEGETHHGVVDESKWLRQLELDIKPNTPATLAARSGIQRVEPPAKKRKAQPLISRWFCAASREIRSSHTSRHQAKILLGQNTLFSL